MKPIDIKKYHKLSIETATRRVLEVFYKYPEKEFSLSDLAKEAKVAKPNIGKILDKLYTLGIIEITKLSKIWRIKANTKNGFFIRSKIVYNLNFVYQYGLVEFLNEKFQNPKAIILFGSFRRGEDISTSDIDVAIELSEAEDYKVIVLRELAPLEELISRKIQIHLFNRENVDLNVFNNIANGIVLSGFLEVKP